MSVRAFFSERGPGTNASGLDPVFASRLAAAIAAAEKATGTKAVIRSLFRSYAEQASIWKRSNNRKNFPAAPPGRSLHEKGLAADLERGPVLTWIRAHQKEFGLGWANAKRPGYDAPHLQLVQGMVTPYDKGADLNLAPDELAKLQAPPVDPFGVSAFVEAKKPTTAELAAQAEAAAPITNIANRVLAGALIRKGAKGDVVRELQTFLNGKGATLRVDGDFGWRTRSALKDYQASLGVKVDGVFGPQTLQAVMASLMPEKAVDPAVIARAAGLGAVDSVVNRYSSMASPLTALNLPDPLADRGTEFKRRNDAIDAQYAASAASHERDRMKAAVLDTTAGDVMPAPVDNSVSAGVKADVTAGSAAPNFSEADAPVPWVDNLVKWGIIAPSRPGEMQRLKLWEALPAHAAAEAARARLDIVSRIGVDPYRPLSAGAGANIASLRGSISSTSAFAAGLADGYRATMDRQATGFVAQSGPSTPNSGGGYVSPSGGGISQPSHSSAPSVSSSHNQPTGTHG